MKLELVALSQERIDEIVENSAEEGQVTLALYKEVYPNWNDIEKMDGWPEISKRTWDYIEDKLEEKFNDGKPIIGIWFNNGFSQQKNDIPDWQVRLCGYTLK